MILMLSILIGIANLFLYFDMGYRGNMFAKRMKGKTGWKANITNWWLKDRWIAAWWYGLFLPKICMALVTAAVAYLAIQTRTKLNGSEFILLCLTPFIGSIAGTVKAFRTPLPEQPKTEVSNTAAPTGESPSATQK